MPNWKKVIVSGSNAILNNITASGDISASGDIYATNFIGSIDSASYAETVEITPTAGANNFPIVFTFGDNQLYTDLPTSDFYYRPSTNTLTVENIVGTASISSKVELSDWLSGGTLDLVVGSTTNNLYTVADNELTYNFTTNTLSVPNLAGTASWATNAITASYAENALNISNNTNNRILTATGNNTINAEQNLSFNGTTLSLNGGIIQSTDLGRSFVSSKEGDYYLLQVGDIQNARNQTMFEIRDESGSFYFHTANSTPHYLSTSLLFITGAISGSGLYVDNYKHSIATFTGFVDALQVSASILKTDLLQGGWLSDNGNNRIITSDGDGTFTAESGLTFNGSELSLNGNLNVAGDITAENYIVSSTIMYMTQSFSDGSTIFGDTLTDTHLFTGSVDITGSLTLDGISYPTTDGENGDVITTDGLGNLSIDKPKIYIQVKNAWSTTLPKGTPVYASSSIGNLENVKPASASNADTMPAIGVLASDLDVDGEGLAIVTGFINGVDTSAFNESDVVYVGANGGFTNVKPTGSNLIQNLGIVTKVDASNGSGFVYGSGRANDVPNIPSGYAWVGGTNGVATPTPTSSFAGVGDNLGNHIATQDLDMAGFSISASLNITASGNISASGYVSADHLILNPNTTTTGSNDTEIQIDISLGNEEYKRGVIKRVFDWRENLASADDIDINNQVIADVGEFSRAIIHTNIELKGYRNHNNSFSLLQVTGSINQMVNITGTNPSYTTTTSGQNYIEFIYEGDGVTNVPPLLRFIGNEGANTPEDTIIHVVNNKIKFNIPSSTVNTVNSILSSSLTTVTLDYQLFK